MLTTSCIRKITSPLPMWHTFMGYISCFSKPAIKEIFHIFSPSFLILSIFIVLAAGLQHLPVPKMLERGNRECITYVQMAIFNLFTRAGVRGILPWNCRAFKFWFAWLENSWFFHAFRNDHWVMFSWASVGFEQLHSAPSNSIILVSIRYDVLFLSRGISEESKIKVPLQFLHLTISLAKTLASDHRWCFNWSSASLYSHSYVFVTCTLSVLCFVNCLVSCDKVDTWGWTLFLWGMYYQFLTGWNS